MPTYHAQQRPSAPFDSLFFFSRTSRNIRETESSLLTTPPFRNCLERPCIVELHHGRRAGWRLDSMNSRSNSAQQPLVSPLTPRHLNSHTVRCFVLGGEEYGQRAESREEASRNQDVQRSKHARTALLFSPSSLRPTHTRGGENANRRPIGFHGRRWSRNVGKTISHFLSLLLSVKFPTKQPTTAQRQIRRVERMPNGKRDKRL